MASGTTDLFSSVELGTSITIFISGPFSAPQVPAAGRMKAAPELRPVPRPLPQPKNKQPGPAPATPPIDEGCPQAPNLHLAYSELTLEEEVGRGGEQLPPISGTAIQGKGAHGRHRNAHADTRIRIREHSQ